MRVVKLRSSAFVLAPRNATRFFFFMPTNLLDTNCFGTIFQGAVNFSEVYVSLSCELDHHRYSPVLLRH